MDHEKINSIAKVMVRVYLEVLEDHPDPGPGLLRCRMDTEARHYRDLLEVLEDRQPKSTPSPGGPDDGR